MMESSQLRPDERTHKQGGRKPTTSIRVAQLHAEGYNPREIAKELDKTENAIYCALRGLRTGRLRNPLEAYCLACLSPSVRGGVCHACGAERGLDSPQIPILGNSEPVSLARTNKGLGCSKPQDNSLIMWLRGRGGSIRMRDFEDLNGSGDSAFVREALKKVSELGGFRDRDFEVSEAAGYLTRKLARMYERRYSELTRTRQKQLVHQVLAELLSSFGPTRVRYDPASFAQLHNPKRGRRD